MRSSINFPFGCFHSESRGNRFSWKHVLAEQRWRNERKKVKPKFNSPFDAPVTLGATMERLELTLHGKLSLNRLLGELHEVGAMRTGKGIFGTVINRTGFRDCQHNKSINEQHCHFFSIFKSVYF